MLIGFRVKHPLFLSDFNVILNFPYRFSKNTHISDFKKILSVRAELLHADRQTDGRTDTRTDRHDEANCRLS